MNVLFVIKVKILFFLKGSHRSSPILLTKRVILKSLKNSCFGREFAPLLTLNNVQRVFMWG